MTLDQGMAAVVAAAVGGIFALLVSEWSRWRQRKADEKRSEVEWIHQVALSEARFNHDDRDRGERWQREERLAQEARFREAELRRIAATRSMCILCLDTLLAQIFAAVPNLAITAEWSLSRFPDADLSLLGTPDALVLYAGSVQVLQSGMASRELSPDRQRAYQQGTEIVLSTLRQQEDRVNAGETALRCPKVQTAQFSPEILRDPVWRGLIAQALTVAAAASDPNAPQG